MAQPGPMKAAQPGRREWVLGEAPRTAEGKAPPWVLPNPSDTGTRCSRKQMTIKRKNLLVWWCRSCRRVSAGGVPLEGESNNAPFFPWSRLCCFLRWREEELGKFLPWLENVARVLVSGPQSQEPKADAKTDGSELAWWSLIFQTCEALFGPWGTGR